MPAGEGLMQRAKDTFAVIDSPRLKAMVRRVLRQGLRLKQGLEGHLELREESQGEVDRLLLAAMSTARQLGNADRTLAVLDAAEIHEKIEVIQERVVASDSADEVEGLLRAKILLTEQLQELDGKHREVSLLTSQLLELSSRLSTLAAEIEGQERMDEASLTSMSLILRELNSDLEAQQEIDELG